MDIRFEGRVAIVTGAGGGLGRAHALALAARGAKVVVNDFGGGVDGAGASSGPAERVAEEIRAGGGEAIAHGADVSNAAQVEDMAHLAHERWGRVDILINNAGILRDASFAKMTFDEFRKVIDVHLMGAFLCCKAVWPMMREAQYGRILMTTSSSGLFGNFGQANYAAAKMGLIGLMHVLQIEGEKNNIRVNALAPAAATRMTEGVLPPQAASLLDPASVSPAALYLVSEDAPRRAIVSAIAGGYACAQVTETEGVFLAEGERTPEAIAAQFGAMSDLASAQPYQNRAQEMMRFIGKAAAAAGVELAAPRV